MSKILVIVESPAKAKTLKKYLGQNFDVMASYGHIRDLIPKSGAVEPDNNFAMHYQLIQKNTKHAMAIKKALKQYSALYLATDPDREGEAIAWHIYEFLKDKELQNKTVSRITFHEITQDAIQKAIANPSQLSTNLINAQQARRALDYLVGFTLSPLLWKKVRTGLSAGRVQSPALSLIVQRAIEIEAFESKEYWSILAELITQENHFFEAKLVSYENKKLQQFSISKADEANSMRTHLLEAAKGKLVVEKIEKKERKKQPTAPFITSTLQQEAAHKLGFTAQRTMRIAQQLYEGIETDKGPMGLITYMRTDSTTIAQAGIKAIRDFIRKSYDPDLVPKQVRTFRTKSKNAQEAHEAIRPTQIEDTPETLKPYLSPEQFRLYSLVWKRTLASQMINATLELLSIELSGGKGNAYRVTGSTILNPGFMSVYQETTEADQQQGSSVTPETKKNVTPILPKLQVGDQIPLKELICKQHFTEAPPSYNEASLIKTLEFHGIGRPSTYVPIITTLQQRDYVTLVQKRFHPTDIGRVVHQFLTNYFNQYVDYNFTAKLEDELDSIARGEKNWVPILEAFWKPFQQKIAHIESSVKRQDVTQETLSENCPKCEQVLSKRLGKRGHFIGCSAYPDCDYTRNIEGDEKSNAPEIIENRACPSCQQALQIKVGRYGKFIGCTQYPKCKHIEPLEKPSSTNIQCPECQQADLLQRKSRYGKIFYSCARYPDCQYATWYAPIAQPCPKCAWPILGVKITKRKGTEHVCPRKTCEYSILASEKAIHSS